MKNRQKVIQGNILITIGLLLVAAALLLVVRNIMNDIHAGENADEIMEVIHRDFLDDTELKTFNPENADLSNVPDYVKYPDMELPVGVFDDVECVGILIIDSMGKEFPVLETLNDYNLRYGPCKYSGSPYKDNFVIGAHNNSSHFGGLIRNVSEGDRVTFIDMAGNVFNYTVEYLEVLKPYETTKMIESEWDLSLFTCTWDLGSRYTARCLREGKDVNIVDVG